MGPPAIWLSTGRTKRNTMESIQRIQVEENKNHLDSVLQLFRGAYTFLKDHFGLYLTLPHNPEEFN